MSLCLCSLSRLGFSRCCAAGAAGAAFVTAYQAAAQRRHWLTSRRLVFRLAKEVAPRVIESVGRLVLHVHILRRRQLEAGGRPSF